MVVESGKEAALAISGSTSQLSFFYLLVECGLGPFCLQNRSQRVGLGLVPAGEVKALGPVG